MCIRDRYYTTVKEYLVTEVVYHLESPLLEVSLYLWPGQPPVSMDRVCSCCGLAVAKKYEFPRISEEHTYFLAPDPSSFVKCMAL